MLARHFMLFCIGLTPLVFVGCKSGTDRPTSIQEVAPASVVVVPATDTLPDSPELIARRAQRYTAELEAIIAKRDAQDRADKEARDRAALEHATTLTTTPSIVEWKEPPPLTAPEVVAPAPVVVTPAVTTFAPAPVAPSAQVASAPSVAVPNAGAVAMVTQVAPSTDAFERSLLTRIRENPRDAAAQLDWQLLQFVRDKPAPDLATMAGLPEEDREVLSAVVDGLANYRAGVRNDTNMMLSKKVRPLIASADRLRAQAELHLPTVQLCTRVDGFGVYEPIDPARFVAGKEAQAVLYTEVANFASQLNDKGRHETKLTHEAVLYTETGLPVCEEKLQTITDLSRNRRTDFFVVRVIKLPASLTIGRYLLKVTVTDLQASRVAEATVPVTIVAR